MVFVRHSEVLVPLYALTPSFEVTNSRLIILPSSFCLDFSSSSWYRRNASEFSGTSTGFITVIGLKLRTPMFISSGQRGFM